MATAQPAIPPNGMDKQDLSEAMEWSRHYDTLLLVVTSLFAGANATMMGIVADQPSDDPASMPVGVFGILLAIVTVFFGASFRSIRGRITGRINLTVPDRYLILLRGGEGLFWQWLVYVVFFGAICGFWVWYLVSRFREHSEIWAALAFVSLVFLIALFILGRQNDDLVAPRNI